MKIGFSTLACPEWSWQDIYSMAKDFNFDGIEIRGLGDEIFSVKAQPFTDSQLPKTIEKLKSLGLEIPCLSSGACLKYKDRFAEAEAEITAYAQLANKLGASYIRILADRDPGPEGEVDDEYIAEALHEKMGEYEYNCDHYLKALHCLQENVLEETKHLFLSPTQDVCILHLLTELSKIDKETLHQLCDSIGGTDSLVRSYRKCIDVFYGFMDIYPFILPAESYLHMIVKIDEVECISSCSFSDIKTFYQDGYESLLSLFYIPVSIDNIIYRMDRNKFNDIYDDANYKKGVHSIKDYRKLDNGTRANKIVDKEIMQGFVDIPANRLLRNGIGHNSVIYDGVTQNISVLEMKKNGKVVFRTNLMNMAIDCLGLAKSSVILSEIILFLLREELRRDRIKTLIHPSFYKGVEPNKKCPCGSGIKYKKCCKNDYESLLYRNMR